MTMHLERLRDDVRSTLGLYLTESTIDDQAIDAALRHALHLAAQYLPMVAKTVTLTADGPTQDITAQIPDIAKVMEVRYPYDPDFPTANTYPYSQISHGIVQFKYGSPVSGDQVLVIGRPRYTLAGVNGAADTLPEQFDAPIAAFAAAHLIRTEGYRRAVTAAEPTTDAKARPPVAQNLPLLATTIEQSGIDAIYALEPVKQNPNWGSYLT